MKIRICRICNDTADECEMKTQLKFNICAGNRKEEDKVCDEIGEHIGTWEIVEVIEKSKALTAEDIKRFQNPYPKDIFMWNNKEKLDFNRGRFNRHCYEIVENMRKSLLKEINEDGRQEMEKELKEQRVKNGLAFMKETEIPIKRIAELKDKIKSLEAEKKKLCGKCSYANNFPKLEAENKAWLKKYNDMVIERSQKIAELQSEPKLTAEESKKLLEDLKLRFCETSSNTGKFCGKCFYCNWLDDFLKEIFKKKRRR